MKYVLALFVLIFAASPALAHEKGSSVYERVMKAGKIRCGYIVYPPAMMIDPTTGELSGIFHDFMEEIGHKLSLEVEWVEETGWGSFINDLKTNRYDMMCADAWKNSARARQAVATSSLYYSGVATWVRADDDRFNDSYKIINDPQYSVAIIDGSTPDFIAQSDFPKARRVSVPELSSYSDLPLSVQTGKADATFLEKYAAQLFLKNNPDTIKQVGKPVRFYGNVMWIKKGEQDFLNMINIAIEEILNTSFLESLYEKYDIPADAYYPPAQPYEVK